MHDENVERIAEAIHAAWADRKGWRPWKKGGTSLWQIHARYLADHAIRDPFPNWA